MGKISDALEKLGSLEGTGIVDRWEGEKDPQLSKSPGDPSKIAIEKDTRSVESNRNWDKRLLKAVNNGSKMIEVFDALRSTVLYPPDGRAVPRSIMVASSIAQEGKSFIAANLGVSLTRVNDTFCLLLDSNLRNPTLASSFGIQYQHGLSDYLMGQGELSELPVETSLDKLSVLPSGAVHKRPEELLDSPRMYTFIDDLASRYADHTIIVDSPPLLLAAESLALADQVEAIILVVRRGRARKSEVQQFIDAVDKRKILGTVFNDPQAMI